MKDFEPAHEIYVLIAYSKTCLKQPLKIDKIKILCLGYICLTTSIRCPYDVQSTVSVRPPQGDLAIIVRIYGHRGLYDFV